MEYVCIEELHNLLRSEKAIFGQPTSPTKCTSNFFLGGGRDGDTLCTSTLLQAIFAFTHPYFKMFLERFLNDHHSPLPHFKYLSLLPPPKPPPPPPIKNFDRTLRQCIDPGVLTSKSCHLNFSPTVLFLVFRVF